VVVPSVFPRTPWVTRKLTDSELLAALDVPVTRTKATNAPTAQLWGRELRVPFKVRAEVCDWVFRLAWARRQKQPSSEGGQREAKRSKVDCAGYPPQGWEEGCSTPSPSGDVGDEGGIPPQDNLQLAKRKHDNAEVQDHLWNDRARQDLHLKLSDGELDRLRVCLIWYWKQLVATEFARQCRKWQKESYKIGKDNVLKSICVGASALAFAAETTRWDWPRGLATFFWSWPSEYQDLMVQDGMAPQFIGKPP
jgi:hypothetical protein